MYGSEAFQSGLRLQRGIYLDKLLHHASLDESLNKDDYIDLVEAFGLLNKYMLEKPNKAGTITLEDLEDFGVQKEIIIYLGRMIHGLEDENSHSIDSHDCEVYGDDFEKAEEVEECEDNAHNNDESDDDVIEDASVMHNNFMSNTTTRRLHSRDDEGKSSKDSYCYGSINESITMQMKAESADYPESKGGDDSAQRYLERKNSFESIDSDCSYDRDRIETSKPGMRQPSMTQSAAISLKSRAISAATSGAGAGTVADDRRSVTASAAGLRKSKQSAASSWIAAREWRLGEKIGSGSFGDVFMGLNNKGKLFAVKKMNIKDKTSEVNDLISEIQMMKGLSHKHIVEYIGALVDSDEIAVYIFQEWVPGGSLAHLLKKFGPLSLDTVRSYTKQILLGLQYLHSNGIIHRDIKGGNILVDDVGTVKLADFGASTTLSQFDKTQETSTIKGTPYFMAPEVLSSSKYGRKGDVWAVGCTMIQMLSGEPPWKDQNLKGLIQLHLLLQNWDKGPPPYKTSSKMTPEADECLRMCFVKDPDNRPRVAELLQCAFLSAEEDDNDDMYIAVSRSYSDDYSNRNTPHANEKLEDSGVISGLKLEMAKALSQSRNSKPGPLKAVDLRLKPNFHVMPSNSDDSNTGNTTHNKTEETMAGIERQIQYRNNKGAYPDGPSTPITPITPRLEPKYSADIPLPMPVKPIYQVSNFSSDSQGPSTNQSSKNPFSRGAIAVKSSSSSVNASSQNSPLIPHISTDRRSDAYYNTRDFTPPISSNSTLHRRGMLDPSTADAMDPSDLYVKDKLSLVKNRVSNHRASRQGNQSSNRDSEDLTPLAGDNSDNEYDGRKYHGSAVSGSSSRLPAGSSALHSHHMHRSAVQNDEEFEDTQELNIISDHYPRSDRSKSKIQPLLTVTTSRSGQSHSSAATFAAVTPRDHINSWRCLACNKENSSNPDYCDYCAVVRGSNGRKGANVVIQRKS